jgi:Rad52/22 family double-strand break repair protein
MTRHIAIFRALSAQFGPGEVKARSQAGRQFSYVTARTIMNRLDEVLGPENWWDEYAPLEKSVICRLTIRLPDGTIVTKVDAGGMAGMSDAGDDDKSGYSDAFKRAAVKFGVSRYLYGDGVAKLVSPPPPAAEATSTPPPRPKPGSDDAQGRGGKMVYGASGAKPKPGTPKTGEDLYYYAANNAIDPNLVNWISNTHTPMGFPEKIVQWSPDEVRRALPSVREHLETVKQARARMKASA